MESVLLLSGQNAIENAIDALAQSAVVEVLQGINGAFQCLVQIRVEGVVAFERAVECARSLVEVGDVPVLTRITDDGGRMTAPGLLSSVLCLLSSDFPPGHGLLLPARAAAADQPGQRRVELPPSSSWRARGR